jgi:hypothetical protein
MGFSGRFLGHFDLNGRDRDARSFRFVSFCQIDTAGAKAAADVKNLAVRWEIGYAREVLDQLELRLFFWFVAMNPITVVQVFAPQREVVRTDKIIVVSDFFLLVVRWHG